MKKIDIKLLKSWYIKRKPESHKGMFGHAFIMAGSSGYTGAAYIAAQSAVRSGTGLVTLAAYPEILDNLSSRAVEYMTVSTTEKERLTILMEKCTSAVFGPGMGNTHKTRQHLEELFSSCSSPIVIDADGINVLENYIEILLERKGQIILTPHPGEFSRITKIPIKEIEENREEAAKSFAKRYGIILVLKGHKTLVTDGEEVYCNTTGCSAMASGGMGDALAGIITSLISQGYEPLKACAAGVFIHGYCGDELSKKMFCVNAGHIIEELPKIMKKIWG